MTASRRVGAPGFQASYDSDSATLNQAREDLGEWVANRLPIASLDDAQLVLSELASNAIEASPHGSYEVVARLDERVLSLSVANESDGPVPAREHWGPADPLARRGRGLMIVSALSDSVEVEDRGGRVIVTARLPLEP